MFGSATINDLVRGVSHEGRSVFMWGGDRSLSSCVVKDVGKKIENARTLGRASSASNKGENA